MGWVIVLCVIFGAITGTIADVKGYNGKAWAIGGFLSPIIALLIIVFTPAANQRLCQFCKSDIATDATVCPKCRKDL